MTILRSAPILREQLTKDIALTNNDLVGPNLINKDTNIYRVTISIIFGFLGFAANFYPVNFVFYNSYKMSFFRIVIPHVDNPYVGLEYGL